MPRSSAVSVVAMTVLLVAGGPSVAQESAAADPAPGQAQLDFANGLFLRGFFEEAVEEYEGYLKAYPEAPETVLARYRLGKAAHATGQYGKALAAFDAVLGQSADADIEFQSGLGKGESLFYLKKFDEAVAVLAPLSSSESPAPVRARALYYLGKVRQAAGDPDAASATYRTLIDAMPGDALAPYARYELAFACVDRGDIESAAIEFSAVANAKDVDPELRMESRYRAAEAYDKIGWFSAAVGAYDQLRQEFPASAYARRAEYGHAWALFHAGKFAEAVVAAEAFLKSQPDSPYRPGLEYLRGNCQQQQARHDEALATYAALMEKHPDTEFGLRAQYKTAWVRYLKGDVSGAKEAVTAFLQRHKDSPFTGDAGFLLGTILAAEGNYEDAYQEFRLVSEKYPNSEFGIEAHYKSAECLSQLGLADEAARVFEDFARKYPDSPLTAQAILRAGDAQFGAADFEQAVAQYQRILDNPGDATVEEDTLYRLAITYHNMKDFATSVATFKRLIEKHPQSGHVPEAHLRTGDYLLRDRGDPLRALDAYQAALDSAPEDSDWAARALRGLALARYEQKDFDHAAELFLRLVRDHGSVALNEETYAWVGQRLYDAERWDEAAQVLKALLDRVPDYPNPERVRFKIAECSEKAERQDEAIALYQEVVDAAPASLKAVEAKYRMAGLHEAKGDMEKAVALYEASANANTGDVAARARYRLGEIYEEREEYEKAARSYLRVAILFLHEALSPESLWRAGQCFEQAGSTDRARKAYEEIVTDYPESEQAAKAREAIERLPAAESAATS